VKSLVDHWTPSGFGTNKGHWQIQWNHRDSSTVSALSSLWWNNNLQPLQYKLFNKKRFFLDMPCGGHASLLNERANCLNLTICWCIATIAKYLASFRRVFYHQARNWNFLAISRSGDQAHHSKIWVNNFNLNASTNLQNTLVRCKIALYVCQSMVISDERDRRIAFLSEWMIRKIKNDFRHLDRAEHFENVRSRLMLLQIFWQTILLKKHPESACTKQKSSTPKLSIKTRISLQSLCKKKQQHKHYSAQHCGITRSVI